MPEPVEPIVVAETGTFVVAELGPRVLLLDRGRVPTEIHVLLLAMSTLIFGGFGVVSLFYIGTGTFALRSTVIGIGLLGVGIASFVAMNRVTRAVHRSRATPLSSIRPVAVFDRSAQVYLDGNGEMVAHLSQIRFTRTGLGSSTLVVVTPDGERPLLTGSRITGGVGNLDTVLTHAVAATC